VWQPQRKIPEGVYLAFLAPEAPARALAYIDSKLTLLSNNV
jgi:hypothetical protein